MQKTMTTKECLARLGDDVTHRLMPRLVALANVRDRKGLRKNVMLTGPAGSGKSTAGALLAKALDVPFGYIPQVIMPHELIGYRHTQTGEWVRTAFVDTFINGGVCVWEEYDAWSPNATISGNAPLANGYITAPDGTIYNRHPDCIIIAAANTWGTGATMEYVGRNKLDAATLDRFVKLEWGYDERLEKRAVGADMEHIADFVQTCRHNARKAGLKVMITPRSSLDIADMVRHGFSVMEAADMSFLAGLDNSQKAMLLDGAEDYILDDDNTSDDALALERVFRGMKRR